MECQNRTQKRRQIKRQGIQKTITNRGKYRQTIGTIENNVNTRRTETNQANKIQTKKRKDGMSRTQKRRQIKRQGNVTKENIENYDRQ